MSNTGRSVDINQLLPPPFVWVQIPGGRVTLEETGGYLREKVEVTVSGFSIAKYPITIAQYQAFIDAEDGYSEPRWWAFSDEARAWRNAHPRPQPVRFGEDDHPRADVTWYEAVAFCRWVGEKVQEPIRLPTEAQWQRAAQGKQTRKFPWGNSWDASKCRNSTEVKQIGTSSVRLHKGLGNSPDGVIDMAGNVWEWTLTGWNSGRDDLDMDDLRVMRGGSWFDDVTSFFQTTARQGWNPDAVSDMRGFRIARAY